MGFGAFIKCRRMKSVFQSREDHPQMSVLVMLLYPVLYSCDLDLDLDRITLVHRVDLDILKRHLHTKNDVSNTRLSNIRGRPG